MSYLDLINSLRSASFPLSQIWLLSFSIIIVSINHFISFSIRVLSNKSCVLPFHDLLARSKVCHGGCNEEPPTVQLLLRDMALKGRRRDIAMTHLWRNTHWSMISFKCGLKLWDWVSFFFREFKLLLLISMRHKHGQENRKIIRHTVTIYNFPLPDLPCLDSLMHY